MIESRYKRVIVACALEKDIELMPEGDMTLVGEKGLSLSGGQKARINLARALYYNADIYLLDDPLTAVDARVGRHIFDECIQGLLKECPTILVTHQLQFLNNATQIICLKEGRILGIGTYTELASSGIDLISLIKTKPTQDAEDSSVDSALEEEESSESSMLIIPDKSPKRSSSIKALCNRRSFSSLTDIELKLDTPANESQIAQEVDVEPEDRLRGSIPCRFYLRLFNTGANFYVLALLFILFILTQGAYTFGDWWLAHW
ncbi:Multidrug resistance-associated protein 4 [Exaiptasia diaphana]|nr:Multidrug resistance-associated protein 4 [Exaiptasia diaphana]